MQAALERLAEADILLVQGLPPEADYRFKHALILDAAYENLLKSRRQVWHRRVAEELRDNITASAAPEPELLAHHFNQAGMTEEAIEWWGKAGLQSLERSALVEAVEQLERALDQIATLPGTPALRREEIKLQVALITPLIHIKGYAAPETRAATERARLLIEQAEALGEAPQDPLLLFSALYGLWVARLVAFEGHAVRDLAAQFLALAEKQEAIGPLMIGHRIMGGALLHTGDIAQSRAHYDQALALYDPAEHRPLATRFGQDGRVAILSIRSMALWYLGYPDAALADADHALKDARRDRPSRYVDARAAQHIVYSSPLRKLRDSSAQTGEVIALADEKGALYWKTLGMLNQACVLALTGKASNAVYTLTSELAAYRSTGGKEFEPFWLLYLTRAYAELRQFDDAGRCIGEAIMAVEATNERLWEAEVNRVAGEIAIKSPQHDAAKAKGYFERALTVARQQQAKSWELRAAMSMARLWRDQGKREEARDLLAPVYGWFTEGFDTLDLKEAKVLLDELAS